LLDATELEPRLRHFDWIDLRSLMWWAHEVARIERVVWPLAIVAITLAFALLLVDRR